jgi:hypothetical protein
MSVTSRPLLGILGMATILQCAFARPVVIEESARFPNPDPVSWPGFGGVVASNGTYALVLASRTGPEDQVIRAALLYRKVAGQWQFERILDETARAYDSYIFPNDFAFEGNLAIVELDGRTRAWRLTPQGWQSSPAIGPITEDIELDGENIIYSWGDCQWNGTALDADGSGGWVSTQLIGQPRGCDDEFWGGEVDRLGNFAILGTAYTFDLEDHVMPIFERTAEGWGARDPIVEREGARFTGAVGLSPNSLGGAGVDAIVDSYAGAFAFGLPEGFYHPHGRLQSADAYVTARLYYRTENTTIERGGGMVFIREPNADRGVNVINVYRGDHVAGYQHLAVLAARNGVNLNRQFDVAESADGVIVIASGGNSAFEFRLPADFSTPAPRYENFESGSAAGWQTVAASQFAVVAEGNNRVYRQSNDTGDARALLGNTTWRDQSIEADVTPTAFNGNDRWVGLVTRYQDSANYYYLTLRSSGSVQLRRMRAGVFTELARASLPVTIGRVYRLRLESVGSVHRVYVDGLPVLDVDDASHMSAGQAGITMYRARADYDNVIVTPSPFATLFRDDFTDGRGDGWTHTGSGQWLAANGTFAQNSVAADARALIGTPVTDQVVRARIRPIAYAAASGTQERWSGLIARYADDSNYYYVTLRTSNQLSLRKLVNGSIVTLGSVPQTVALNVNHDLKLEAVGNQLRVYLNGRLRLQAQDSAHPSGRAGLMTYKTAANYDDYLAYRP